MKPDHPQHTPTPTPGVESAALAPGSDPSSGSNTGGQMTNVHIDTPVTGTPLAPINKAQYNPQFTPGHDPQFTPIYTPMPPKKYSNTKVILNSNSSMSTSMSSLSDSSPNSRTSRHSKYSFFRSSCTSIQSLPLSSDEKPKSPKKKLRSFVSAAKSTVLHPFSFHSHAYLEAKKQSTASTTFASPAVTETMLIHSQGDGVVGTPLAPSGQGVRKGRSIENNGTLDKMPVRDNNISDLTLSNSSAESEEGSAILTTNYDLIMSSLEKKENDNNPCIHKNVVHSHQGICSEVSFNSYDDRVNENRRNIWRDVDQKESIENATSRSAMLTLSSDTSNGQKKSDNVNNFNPKIGIDDSSSITNDKNRQVKLVMKKRKLNYFQIIRKTISDFVDDVGIFLLTSPVFAVVTIFSSACVLLLRPFLILFAIILFVIGRHYTNQKSS